jgi:glycosyltransferase involved in cell wall biosynthesis
MTKIDATVLLPTFDHGPMIRFPLESALAQTARNIEIFVVGDGVPDVTREVVGELTERDPRIRFFDNPKGPRHGEVHRHAALAEAGGRVVLYLSDDDLWFPDHVATMLRVLDGADVATAVSLRIVPGKNPRMTSSTSGSLGRGPGSPAPTAPFDCPAVATRSPPTAGSLTAGERRRRESRSASTSGRSSSPTPTRSAARPGT